VFKLPPSRAPLFSLSGVGPGGEGGHGGSISLRPGLGGTVSLERRREASEALARTAERQQRRGGSAAIKEAEQGPLVGIVRLVSAEGEDPRLRRVRVSPLPQAQLPRADGAKQDQQGGAPVEGPGRDKKGPGPRRGACASSCAPSRPSPPRWKRPCAPRAPTSAPSLRPRAPGDDQRPRPAHACGSWQRQRR